MAVYLVCSSGYRHSFASRQAHTQPETQRQTHTFHWSQVSPRDLVLCYFVSLLFTLQSFLVVGHHTFDIMSHVRRLPNNIITYGKAAHEIPIELAADGKNSLNHKSIEHRVQRTHLILFACLLLSISPYNRNMNHIYYYITRYRQDNLVLVVFERRELISHDTPKTHDLLLFSCTQGKNL